MNKDKALRLALEALEYPGPSWLEARQPAIAAIKQALAQPEPEPAIYPDEAYELGLERIAYYTSPPPPKREPLTEREIELLDGMIEVQLRHAEQCDRIANRTMAEKQKGWDMERVALLQKLKVAHGIKGEA